MGLYVATVKLFCDSKDGDVLKRFAEINTQAIMTPLGLLVFDKFDAPEDDGTPPIKFTEAVEAAMMNALSKQILKDMTTDPNVTVVQLTVFPSWSPPAGSNPHEGGDVVRVTLRDGNGGTKQDPWVIKRTSGQGSVKGFAQWSYIDAFVSA